MNKEELLIFNDGERLIPGISHQQSEYLRHRSSYDFFIKLIKENNLNNKFISILDLGCGVGWGTKLLVEAFPKARVTGVDNSEFVLEYARKNYYHYRISYDIIDLTQEKDILTLNNYPYDYIVGRGVLEHIDNGLELIKNISYNKMLIFDVPYNEAPGNPHHKLNNITESMFKEWNNIEFYYESFNGGVVSKVKQPDVNMLLCVCRR